MGVADRSVLTPPLTVHGTAEVTWVGLVVAVIGKLVEIFVVETPVTVAAGLVVISGDTTATGVPLDTDEDTSGVVRDETGIGAVVTAVPLTTPVVGVPGAADLGICVNEDGVVDSAAVALAMLTAGCTGVGVEVVAVMACAVVLGMDVVTAPVAFKDGALAVAAVVMLGFIAVADITACEA